MAWARRTFWRWMTALVNRPFFDSPFYVVESLHIARAYGVVAELGIADLLHERPLSAAELATATDADPQALLRILRTLAAFGVFAQDRDGRFRLTRRAQALRSGVPGSLRSWLRLMGRKEMWQAYSCTLEGVRSGKPPFEIAHGMSFWSYVEGNPQFAQTFFAALADWTDGHVTEVVDAFDFGRFRSVIDVGGGMGALLEKILLRYPQVQGTLFDRADTVRNAAERFRELGLADRCQFVGGSFMESVPGGHDAYVLKQVIADWHDDGARDILSNVRRSMDAGATLLVIGAVVDPRNGRHRTVKLLDQENAALLPGRFRTREELDALLASSGFELVRVHPTSYADLHIAEGRPAAGAAPRPGVHEASRAKSADSSAARGQDW